MTDTGGLLGEWFTRARSALGRARGELLIVALLTIAALVVRVVHLVEIPPGLHGDEGWTGIRASDILHGVNISPFDRVHGLGQPAGMEYLTAGFVRLFGNSTLTIRLPMALLGTATVPLTYWLARESFDRTMAVISAALLAFLGWHIHFSRIALPPVSLPFFEVLACLFLMLAFRSRKWWQFVLAGASLGMGVYSYSSYSVFVPAFVVFVGYWFLTKRPERPRRLLVSAGAMFLTALLVALPMLIFIRNNEHVYFDYPRQISIFNSDAYKHADGLLAHADVLADAGRDFVQRVVFDAVSDPSDGAGSGPMLDTTFSILLGLGILLALWRWREPGAALALLVLLIVPWAGILTVGSGVIRRAVGVTPFLAILAALPLAELLRRSQLARPAARGLAYFVVAAAIVSVAVLDMRTYFGIFPDSAEGQYVFAHELVAASNYMDKLPDQPEIYFYSDRWRFNYEVRRYLAPSLTGVDRSERFGFVSFTLDADRSRNVVFVFLGRYLGHLEEAKRRYPEGTAHEERGANGKVLFQAYELPRAEGGARPPTDATPAAAPTESLGARQRDAARLGDLATLEQALERYRLKHGAYPDNGGAFQALCVDPENVGCSLKEVVDPLPQDPLGDPATNGYWYTSDGTTYTLFVQRESNLGTECGAHPEQLTRFSSVMCVRSP